MVRIAVIILQLVGETIGSFNLDESVLVVIEVVVVMVVVVATLKPSEACFY